MNESDLSGKLMPQLNKDGHAIRIENGTEGGTPDVNYAFIRAQGWIETKIVHGSYLYFERFQIPWFRKRLRATAGAHVWVLAADADTLYLFPAGAILEVPREAKGKWIRCTLESLKPRALLISKEPWDWKAVIRIITYA